MAGRKASARHTPGPIPSTVSEFACIDFVNSAFDDHLGSGQNYDRMGREEWWRWFTERWHLGEAVALDRKFLREMKALRVTIRMLLEGKSVPGPRAMAELNHILGRSPSVLAIQPAQHGVRLVLAPVRSGRASIAAAIVQSLGTLMEEGDLSRVKVCRNPDCSFLFYDGTNNLSRRWCDPRICGNLIKVRAHRAARR